MSVKSKLLDDINKKAQKIRDKRTEAANNKTIEAAVFEFFQHIEESRQINGDNQYDYTLFNNARVALETRLKSFDAKVKVSIEYDINPESYTNSGDFVRGVTIWWSDVYIKKNSVDPSLYIDVSQMLFI